MHPLICEEQKKQLKKVPEIRTGYTVRVSQRITEGTKERIQNFEGLVIKVGHGEGAEATFTVRKIVEGIGVEKIYPLHSPNIKKIVVIKKAKVRRSKLYYMRERSGKSARLTERHVTDEERATEEAKMEVLIDEAVKAEEKRKKEDMPESSTDRTDEVTEDSAESVTANPPAEGIEAETEERTESAPVESEAPAEPEAEPEKTEEAPVEEAPVEETPAEEKEEKKDEAEAEVPEEKKEDTEAA